MEEKNISEKESLLLIQQMIRTAKEEQKDDGRGWIVWGWMLFFASALSIVNIRLNWRLDGFFFWNLFGAVAAIYFLYGAVAYIFFRRHKRVRTYTGDLFSRLNAGFFISLVFIILSINIGARLIYHRFGSFDITPINIGFALLINLYAFWVLIYGTALSFRPSVIAAYITWAIGFGALFVKSFEQAMMFHALGVLTGYIIPGHIANREFKKTRRKDKEVEGV